MFKPVGVCYTNKKFCGSIAYNLEIQSFGKSRKTDQT